MSQPHLIGAIRDYLLTQPVAASLSGGIADGQASRDSQLPYLVLEAKDSTSVRLFGGHEVYTASVFFSVFASTRSVAESLGNQIRHSILPPNDAPTWSALAIEGGWRDVNRQPAGGEAVEIDPETRAAFGVDVWVCRKPISWTISR